MPERNGWRLAAALGLLIVLVGAALAAYDAIWPRQSGTNVLTSKSLVVDASNASQGYIMARGDAGNKRLKLRVTQGQYKLTYDLNTSGDYEVFPLQLGDGSYTVELFENVSGKKYSAEGKVSVNVKLDDPFPRPQPVCQLHAGYGSGSNLLRAVRGHDRSAGDF